MTSPSSLLHFRAAGVSLVIDADPGRLPAIIHWGRDLGDLSDTDLASLAVATWPAQVGGHLDSLTRIAVVPETASGWLGFPGLAGSRGGRDHSPAFVVASAEVSEEGGAQRLRSVAEDAVAELRLTVDLELLPSGLLRARASLASLGHGTAGRLGSHPIPYTVEHLNVHLPVPQRATALQDFHGRWIRERTPQRMPFSVGTHLRESRRGKPGHDSAFLLTAGTDGFGFRSGEVWSTHVAWSGNTRLFAERSNGGHTMLGGGELAMPGELQLEPGEEYVGPWVYGAYGGEGLDSASARIHAWMRSRPQHPRSPRPVSVNTWEAVYFDHDHDKLYALADAAADVGAERFVLDDGWFLHRRADNAGLGDWFVDPSVYPEGLAPLADYVRSRGLEFGLWFEPEMINPDSDLARAHPEWIAQPEAAGSRDQARLPWEARSQQVLDLTHPEAYAFIEERLHALVADLRPAYLKWDHNRDLVEAGNSATGLPSPHGQTVALYRLLDGLKAAFPGLEIETCAGGGGRMDLEVLQRTDRVWTSDCNDAHERQRQQLYTSLVVPPEMMGAHIGPPTAHTTGRTHGLDFRAGTAMWGHLGIEWNVAGDEASTPENRAAIRAWVALHKEWREVLHSGVVVRSDDGPAGRIQQGVVSQDRFRGLFSVAALETAAISPVGPMRLHGLDAGVTYRVFPVGPLALGDGGARVAPSWWRAGEVVLPGSVLATVGVEAPAVNPDEVALVGVEAVRDVGAASD